MPESRPARILVVDDDALIRDAIRDFLSSRGCEVAAVGDARTAMDVVEREGGDAIDVVVTDVRMPGVDGLALLQRLLGRSPRPDVILMTAHADVGDAVRALREGAVD